MRNSSKKSKYQLQNLQRLQQLQTLLRLYFIQRMSFLNDSHRNKQMLGITARSGLACANHALRVVHHHRSLPLSEAGKTSSEWLGGLVATCARPRLCSMEGPTQLAARAFNFWCAALAHRAQVLADAPRALVACTLSSEYPSPRYA